MKKVIAALLSTILVFSTAIVGIPPLRAKAEGNTQTAGSVLNAEGVVPYDKNSPIAGNIYGTDKAPFLLSEMNELYVLYSGKFSAGTLFKSMTFDDLSMKITSSSDGNSFVKTPNVSNYTVSQKTLMPDAGDTYRYRFVKGVGFDPTGSGRKDYAAYVGVLRTGDSTYNMHCFVVKPGSTTIYSIDLGTTNWVGSHPDDYELMTNFMAITAGDYDGDHKDSIIVYYCGDKRSSKTDAYVLFEVKFNGSSLSKTKVLDLSTVIKNDDSLTSDDCKLKPIVSLTTGDFDDDQTEEFAYSVGFHNTSSDKKDGWKNKAVSTMDYFATAVGVVDYSGKWSAITPARLYTKGARTSLSGNTEVFPYTIIQGGAISGGDLNGDGKDEIVLVGYSSYTVTATFESGKMTSVSGVGDLDKLNYYTSIITCNGSSCTASDINTISHNEFNKASVEKFQNQFYVYPQIAVECVATNGKNQAEDVFVGGSFYSYKAGAPSHLYSVKVATQHFNTILDDKTGTDSYFFGSTAVGNFDNNGAGREQIFYAVWFRADGKDEYNSYVGIAGGAEYNDQTTNGEITKFGTVTTYACSNTRGEYSSYFDGDGSKADKEMKGVYCNVAPVAVDVDNDGLLARYSKTGYVYTDPEVVAVLEAAPYFSKIDDMGGYDDPCGTSYSISTSYEYSTSSGDSVSFGAGFAGEVSAGFGKMALELGYSLEWSQEFEDAYSETSTTTWSAQYEDIVCIKRTPVAVYCYDIYQNGKWIENGHTIEVPLAPTAYSLSIDEYNEFVDEYNSLVGKNTFKKITTGDLPANHQGNPFGYYSSWNQAGTGGQALSSSTYALGYNGGFLASELSKAASTSESTSMSHGFSYSLTLQFGGGVGGSGGEAWAGGYVNLDYGHSTGSSTTKGTEKAVSGQVQNIRSSALASVMTASEVKQYAFTWELGKWTRQLTTNGNNVPFYGYVTTGVTAPLDPPTNLSAIFTSTDETTNVKIEWDIPEGIPNGPELKGYYIYDNGEQVNKNLYIPTDTSSRVTYIHNGVSYGSKHAYTVKAVSMLNGVELSSVESEEVDIGWVTTGNIIDRIYKDETYTSDPLKDRYVIMMSDGSEFPFFVTNGKNGTDGIDGLDGVDGKSAYEIAVANGYEGSESEWLGLIGATCAKEGKHSFKNYSIPATCGQQGITVKVCEICGWAEVEVADAKQHNYQAVQTVEPTCQAKGYTIYKCNSCGDFYISDETDSLTHSWATKTVKNTCCTEGYTVKYCVLCGVVDSYDISAAAGHKYEQEKVIEPTCMTKGYTVSKCSVCGDEIITDETDFANHNYETESHEATCIDAGFITHTCTVCSSMYITNYTAALGHDYIEETVSPTCSQKGYTVYTCQREGCDETHIADITNTVPHSFKDKVVKNTCLTDGYTIHYCEFCGYQQIIDETAAKNHTYEVLQIIAPTCTAKGYTIYCCKDCGSSYKGDETDFAEHTPGGWICDDSENGHYIRKCEKCSIILEEKTVSFVIGGNTEEGTDIPVSAGETVVLKYGSELVLASGTLQSKKLMYSSSDPTIATVDENGVITAENSGTVTITVTDKETGISTSFNVEVKMTWWQKIHKILDSILFFRALFMLFGVTV